MLTEIVVQNLVIVAAARLCPGPGLTVVSGETGAGKSLILDALALLLGGRAQGKLVGPVGDSAVVSATFQVAEDVACAVEAACGVAAVDGQVIVRRRLGENGRSQAWINDVPVTVTALRAIADCLVEIHAQHEALRLSDPARQLALLDGYGGIATDARAYSELHRLCLEREQELAALDGGERESLKELDYLRYQAGEFATLDPKPGELVELERRQALLAGAETWKETAAHAAAVLSDGPRAVVPQLAQLARKLADAPDPGLAQAAAACRQACEAAQEAGAACSDALDRLHGDPRELERVQERLNAWYELMRKHGDGEAALLTAWATVTTRMQQLQGLGERRQQVASELEALRAERDKRGAALAEARAAAFRKLAKAVHQELADLGMPKAKLSLGQQPGAPGPLGTVAQEFLVATNPGLPPGTLAEIASGGEAARLTLALAAVLAAHDRTPVLVFDEVDSGVGGRLGGVIGAKLATLAQGRSVIAVTHTPQLAAVAHRHYVVRKIQGDRQTTVTVEEVSGSARASEIADMLGGGAAALGQAKALLVGGNR